MLNASDMSVIIPAYNAAATIAETIRSLFAQTAGPPHVVVVDDASTDATVDMVRGMGVDVITQERGGPGAARNCGVESTQSPLVAFCDADDTWPSDRVAEDLEVLNTRPNIDLVLGRTRFDADDDEFLHGHHFDSVDRSALIPHFGAVTMRRTAFERVGRIAPNLRNYEDYDWFLRLREAGVPALALDRVSLHRRIHSASTSRVHPGSPADLLGVLRQSVRRRRITGSTAIPQLGQLRQEQSR